MDDHWVLNRALSLLGWDTDRLLEELNIEGDPPIARSTVNRWLVGTSPVNAGVKAFLRERIQTCVPMKLPKPRPSTRVLMVGPQGCGKTPMAYELAACAKKIGITTKVDLRGDYEETFPWRAAAFVASTGVHIPNRDGEDADLVFIDNVNPSSIWLKDEKGDFCITDGGAEFLDDIDAILMIGNVGDFRLRTFIDMISSTKSEDKATLGCLGVRSAPCAQFAELVALCVSSDIEMTFYHEPDPGNSLPLFERCLEGNTTKDDLATGTIWNTMYWLIEQLGWPDTLSQVSGGKNGKFSLGLAQIVQAYSSDTR